MVSDLPAYLQPTRRILSHNPSFDAFALSLTSCLGPYELPRFVGPMPFDVSHISLIANAVALSFAAAAVFCFLRKLTYLVMSSYKVYRTWK